MLLIIWKDNCCHVICLWIIDQLFNFKPKLRGLCFPFSQTLFILPERWQNFKLNTQHFRSDVERGRINCKSLFSDTNIRSRAEPGFLIGFCTTWIKHFQLKHSKLVNLYQNVVKINPQVNSKLQKQDMLKKNQTRHGHTHWQIQKTERGDYTFPIVNFPFFSSNIPAAPVYGLYTSQFIRYSRACAQWVDVDSKQIYTWNKCLWPSIIKVNQTWLCWSIRYKYFSHYYELNDPFLNWQLIFSLLRRFPLYHWEDFCRNWLYEYKKQKLLTLCEDMGSPPFFFGGISVPQLFLVFCLVSFVSILSYTQCWCVSGLSFYEFPLRFYPTLF